MAIATVHEAFKQGLNYFDTSPFYGDGLSEIVSMDNFSGSLHMACLALHMIIYQISDRHTMLMQRLGKGLQDLPREQIILATKFGRYGPNLFDFSAERVRGLPQLSSLARNLVDLDPRNVVAQNCIL